jgi:hypothetical protein
MNNKIQDSKKSKKAMYKRWLIENHCLPTEEIETMPTAELKHQYEYWNVVLN